MIKFLIGIVIGVIVIAPFIQDPSAGIEVAKIITEKIVSVGVPIIKDVVAETAPIVSDAVRDVVTDSAPIIGDAIKESTGLDKLIGGVI